MEIPPEIIENAKKGEHNGNTCPGGRCRENQNIRLTPVKMQADLDSYVAWQGIAAYAPANTAYDKTAVIAKRTALKTAQVALATARDAAAAAEWDFHNTMLAIKEQVIAQYGKSSDQAQSLWA